MDFTKVQAYLEHLTEMGMPLVQLAVTKGRELVFSGSVGWADAEKAVPATDRTLCWCYSDTKVYTAVCLMRLVEAGTVALDDPVSKYLPEFEGIRYWKDGEAVRAKQAPTLRQLITMTSGLTYNGNKEYTHFSEAISRPGVTTREAVAALAQEVLAFEPGTEFRYGLGHDVIAAVIEVVTGMRFSEYVRQALFAPLGIEDTGFHPSEEQLRRFAALYRLDPETGTLRPFPPVNSYVFSENYDSGGAGMFSNAREYCKLLTALACGGTGADGYRVLAPESIERLATNQLSGKTWDTYHVKDGKPIRAGYGYGLGVRVHVDAAASRGKTSIGEFGWSGAAGAYSFVDREKQLALCYVEHVLGHKLPAKEGVEPYVRTEVLRTIKNLTCDAVES